MEPEQVSLIQKALENENNSSVMKLTHAKIMAEKNDALQQLQLTSEEIKSLHKTLKGYRFVEEVTDINFGSYIRWIKLTDPSKIKLTNGGILIDIKITDSGLHLLCKNNLNRIMQVRLDETMVFQKLTDQEKIILSVLNHLK